MEQPATDHKQKDQNSELNSDKSPQLQQIAENEHDDTEEYLIKIKMGYDMPLSYYIQIISREMLLQRDPVIQKRLSEIQLHFVGLNKMTADNAKKIIEEIVKTSGLEKKYKEAMKTGNWVFFKYWTWFKQYLERHYFQALLDKTDKEETPDSPSSNLKDASSSPDNLIDIIDAATDGLMVHEKLVDKETAKFKKLSERLANSHKEK